MVSFCPPVDVRTPLTEAANHWVTRQPTQESARNARRMFWLFVRGGGQFTECGKGKPDALESSESSNNEFLKCTFHVFDCPSGMILAGIVDQTDDGNAGLIVARQSVLPRLVHS